MASPICGHKYDKNGRFIGVFAYAVGDEVEWHDDTEAQRMIDRGLATKVTNKTNK